jgi:hypothetical protein
MGLHILFPLNPRNIAVLFLCLPSLYLVQLLELYSFPISIKRRQVKTFLRTPGSFFKGWLRAFGEKILRPFGEKILLRTNSKKMKKNILSIVSGRWGHMSILRPSWKSPRGHGQRRTGRGVRGVYDPSTFRPMLLSRALWSVKTFLAERQRYDNAESRFAARVNVLILEPILCSTHSPHSILFIHPNPCPIPKPLHFLNYLNWLSNDNFWPILGWF